MHGLTIVTGPATEPITLGEAKQHCRISVAEDDALLAGYIIAARSIIEEWCGLALITQTFDLTIDCFPRSSIYGRDVIQLPRSPTQSVTSITYVDEAGALQTLAPAEYQLDITRSPARIMPAYNRFWPSTRQQLAAVTVRFVAGYGANPGDTKEPIRQAMLLLISAWYENREHVVIGTIVSELPMSVQALLAPYRMFWLS